MTLTGAAPTGDLTITLSSNSATATVPQTVTVPAGDTTAPFPITTTPTEATTVATITAVHGEVTKTADLTVEAQTPPAPLELHSLTLSRASIVGGRSATGRVTLTGAAPAGGIEVQLSIEGGSVIVPTSVTVLEGRSGATFGISTTAVSASATATIAAAYAGVTKTAQLRVTPRFEITNVNNGDVLSGYVQVNVNVYDDTVGADQVELVLDGEEVATLEPQGWGAGETHGLMTYYIPTNEFPNGPHQLTIVDAISSDTRNMEFLNAIHSLDYASVFDVEGEEDVPLAMDMTAVVADPANTPYWKLEISNEDELVIKTFTGAVSIANPIISRVWEGSNDSGIEVPDGTYEGRIALSASPFSSGVISTSSARIRNRRRSSRIRSSGIKTASSDPPVTTWEGYFRANKRRRANTLVIVSAETIGYPAAETYAQFINKTCRDGVGFQPSVKAFIIEPWRMRHPKDGPRLRAAIRNQLKRPLDLIYVMAHGAPSRPGFRIGKRWWMSNLVQGDALYGDPRAVNVRHLVAHLN